MNRRRCVTLLALVLVFSAMPLPRANACVCAASGDPRDRLAAADGAFIGTLVGQRKTGWPGFIISRGRDLIYTFEVAEVFKGGIGRRVQVHSAGGSCRFEVVPGAKAIGVLLDGNSRTWRSSLCGQIEPETLRLAATPLPAPDGRAPATLVMGGSVGEARLLSLDGRGRTLAYGFGTGRTSHLSICPGGKRLLETVDEYDQPSRLALRELPGLGLVWERRLPRQPLSIGTDSVKCLDRHGTAYVFLSNGGDPLWSSPKATLLRVSRTATTTLYQGSARSIAFGSAVGYLNEGRWGEQISRIILRSGEVTPLVTGPRYMTRLVLRPDGLALATQVLGDDLTGVPGVDRRGSRPSQAVVIDLEPSPRVRTTIVGRATVERSPLRGNMVWLNAGRIGFVPAGGANPRAIIFDDALREVGVLDDWTALTSLLVGEVLVGLEHGKLRMADLPSGPTRVVREFQSNATFALVALPGPSQALQTGRPAASPTEVPTPPPEAGVPIVPLGAGALVLVAVLYRFTRARRRS